MSRPLTLQYMCIYIVICVKVVTYLSQVELQITLSGNFQKLLMLGISACMIHHQKGKSLNFMMSYVRLRKIKPV